MAIKIKILCIILIVCVSYKAIAQDLTIVQSRNLNLKIYTLFTDYTKYIKYTNIDDYNSYENEKSFIALFTDDATLYCDIKPENRLNENNIKIQEYIELLRLHYLDGLTIKFSNFDFSQPIINGNKGEITIKYKELFSGNTKYYELYEDVFRLNAKILFDIDNEGNIENLKIAEISSSEKRNKFLKIKVISNSDNKGVGLATVKISDNNNFSKTASTNSNGKISVQDIPPQAKVSISVKNEDYKSWSRKNITIDEILKPNKDKLIENDKNEIGLFDPNEIIVMLKPKKFVTDFYYTNFLLSNKSFQFSSIVNQKITHNDLININESSSGFGFLVGYQLLNKEMFNLYVCSGFGFNSYNSSLSIGMYNLEYEFTDADSQTCNRRIQLDSISENISIELINVPLIFSFNYKLLKKLELTTKFGFKYQSVTSALFSNKANALYTNHYQWYDQKTQGTIDFILGNHKNDDYYKTGSYNLDFPAVDLPINKSLYSLLISCSFSYPIFSSVFFYAGLEYNYGINNLVLQSENELSAWNNELKSIIPLYDKVKINSFGLLTGIKIKF